MSEVSLPSVKELYNPVLCALHNLGGEGTNQSIDAEVSRILSLSEEQLSVEYKSRRTSVVLDRIGWARSHLKIAGLLDSPRRKTWALTKLGMSTTKLDPREVGRAIRKGRTPRENTGQPKPKNIHLDTDSLARADVAEVFQSADAWQDELHDILHGMSPQSFARFFEHIFREEGIDQVEVVNTSGNGEIEGTMVSGGFLSFRVAFRFTTRNNLIGSQEVDRFRRFVQSSRADKGILITTGSYTQEAIRDSMRRPNPTIELLDGEQFLERLKERSLGITTRQVIVEQVVVDRSFFDRF